MGVLVLVFLGFREFFNTFFRNVSPIDTDGISRVLLPEMPSSVTVNGKEVFDSSGWDAVSGTYLLTYSNSPDGVKIAFQW